MSLTINHLTVDIEKTPILQEVSLSVADGELLSLLGPSGCGKSTLLKAAAGFIEIAGGQISAGAKRLDHLPPDKRGNRGRLPGSAPVFKYERHRQRGLSPKNARYEKGGAS